MHFLNINLAFGVLTILTIIILPESSAMVGGSGYGELCNITDPCDLPSWLGCFDGKCDCLKHGPMLYDPERKKCVFKAGERCKYGAKVGEENTFLVKVHYCVPHASCNPEGICTCEARYYQTSQGTCEYAQGHLESCNPLEEDRCSLGLECSPAGLCSCNPIASVFSPNDDQCIGLSGRRCINSKCVQNASCTSEDYCECNHGFYPDAEGHCHAKLGIQQNCTEDIHCSNDEGGLDLVCSEERCSCPSGFVYATVWPSHRENLVGHRFHGYEGQATTRCVPLAGHECSDRLCAPRAYCEYSNNKDYSGQCICAPGYTHQSSKNHQCGRGHNESCESAEECIADLVCKNRVCSCEYANQFYDPSHMKCYSKVGGPCTSNEDCVRNAICPAINANPSHHCTCKEGFVENLKGECEEGYGGFCKDKEECDSVANLDCINNVCKCGDFCVYNSKLRKCVGKVGSTCHYYIYSTKKNKEQQDSECVEHAHCSSSVHPKLLLGHCVCDSGFTETGNYTCVKSQTTAGLHDEG